MIYCVQFQDNPGREHLRQQHMSKHLAFLEDHAPRILAAGPLFDNEIGQGGMWLVEADTAEEVEQLIQSDPFWPTGLRKSVTVLRWQQVFRDGART